MAEYVVMIHGNSAFGSIAPTSGNQGRALGLSADDIKFGDSGIKHGRLQTAGQAAPSVSAAGEGKFYFDSTSNTYQFSQNTSAYVNLMGGTVADNEIVVGTGTNTVDSDSNFTWDGSTLGVTGAQTLSGSLTHSGRHLMDQGANVASANNLSLGTDGNTFLITGTTQINLLDKATWQEGSVVRLRFDDAVTVKNGQTTSGDNTIILLDGAADFTSADGDTLTFLLELDGATYSWRELSRSTVAGTYGGGGGSGLWTDATTYIHPTTATRNVHIGSSGAVSAMLHVEDSTAHVAEIEYTGASGADVNVLRINRSGGMVSGDQYGIQLYGESTEQGSIEVHRRGSASVGFLELHAFGKRGLSVSNEGIVVVGDIDPAVSGVALRVHEDTGASASTINLTHANDVFGGLTISNDDPNSRFSIVGFEAGFDHTWYDSNNSKNLLHAAWDGVLDYDFTIGGPILPSTTHEHFVLPGPQLGGDNMIRFFTTSTGTGATDGMNVGMSGTTAHFKNFEAGDLSFFTSNAEKMRYDDSLGTLEVGSDAIGTAVSAELVINARKNHDSGTQIRVRNNTNGTSAAAFFSAINSAGGGLLMGIGSPTYTGLANVASRAFLVDTSSSSNGITIGTRAASTDIRLYTSGTADTNERMRIEDAAIIFGKEEGQTTGTIGQLLRAPDLVTGGAGNVAGADLTISSGLGTGTGTRGTIIIQTPDVATAGDNLQARTTKLTIGETNVTFADAFNISVNTTTGTKIGTATSQKLGFFNATPVAQQSNIGQLTDSTGGTANTTVAAVSGSGDDTTINDNFADVIAKINSLESLVQTLGFTA